MNQSDAIARVRDDARRFNEWMDERVEPLAVSAHPLELAAWRKELSLIRSLIDSPDRVRVALVGTTGAGKSTLLNAILGQEILPVGVMSPCTAFVTSVSHWRQPGYRVTVQYCTAAEWEADVHHLAAALAPGDAEDENSGFGESKSIINAARKRVQAVYQIADADAMQSDALLNLKLPHEAEDIFARGTSQSHDFAAAGDMLKFLRALIRGESVVWPLVKQVSITGPYERLAGGIELVDLPGLNDPNEARVEVTREFLRTSPFVWVVFSMVRGLTQDINTILREEKLLRTLVLSGSYGALSLIGTKADEIDANIAEQLGLPDNCEIPDIIREYCKQTVVAARKQLEEIVLDLAVDGEGGETVARMVEFARNVRVHTTSSSAYNKLEKIGRLLKDYGLEDIEDTGIPEIHDHLAEIGQVAGATFNAQTALVRLRQLRDEIAFFFRAKAQPQTKELIEIRKRLQTERDTLAADINRIRDAANERLRVYREKFLAQLQPLLLASIQGVNRTTEVWTTIHWATLKATVRYDGVFRSPSKGKTYNLNEDLADPLLSQLPVSWERYFTDDLGRVSDDFALRLTGKAAEFCGRVQLLVDVLFKKKDEGVEKQLRWFQDKIEVLAKGVQARVASAVRERRGELAATMPLVAKGYLQPAYDSAKLESGTGTKQRILGHLKPRAMQSAQPIFSSIQADLLEGLNDLELIISGLYRELANESEAQARTIAHNANIEVDEATMDPVLAELLRSVPAMGPRQ